MATVDTMPQATVLASEKPTKQRMLLLAILVITVAIAFLDRANVSVLVANDAFLTEMGIKGQPVKAGMLMSSFLFAYGISNAVLSPVGDYLGPRKAMMIAIFLWGVSLLVGGLTSTFVTIIVTRVLLGVGEGLHYPQQSVFIKKWFPPQERARANALPIIAQSLALGGAMAFFTWVIYLFGWRACFYVCAAMSIIPLWLLWFYTTDTPRDSKKVNHLELQYIEAGLATEAKDLRADPSGTVWENLKLSVYNYRYWLVVVYHSCMNMILWGLVTWLPSYLKAQLGFSWAQMGALASLPFILQIVSKFVSGWLSDRVGRRAPFGVVSMLGTALSILLSIYVSDSLSAALLLIFGLALSSLGTPTNWTLLQSFAASKAISTAAGLMNGIGFFFASLAPMAIGLFISLTGGYIGGLFFLAGLAIIAMFASLVLAYQKY